MQRTTVFCVRRRECRYAGGASKVARIEVLPVDAEAWKMRYVLLDATSRL